MKDSKILIASEMGMSSSPNIVAVSVSLKLINQLRLVALLLFIVAAACAPVMTVKYPLKFDCSTLNQQAVLYIDEPIEFDGFSVMPPSSGEWCVEQDTRGINYVSHPFFETVLQSPPDPDHVINTFALGAQRLKLRQEDVEDAIDLRAFVQKWIDNGNMIHSEGGEPFVSLSRGDRFRSVRSSVWTDTNHGADCVRFEFLIEETDNPRAPGKVLLQHGVGLVCHHPPSSDALTILMFSERHPVGNQADANLFDKLRRQNAEPFFTSLKFTTPE